MESQSEARWIGSFQVMGKKNAVRLYEAAPLLPDRKQDWLISNQSFQAALRNYNKGQFTRASIQLQRLLQISPADAVEVVLSPAKSLDFQNKLPHGMTNYIIKNRIKTPAACWILQNPATHITNRYPQNLSLFLLEIENITGFKNNSYLTKS